MTELSARHLFPALFLAGLLHAGLAVAAFWLPADPGAVHAGSGGLTVSLGSAGGAPGRAAPVEPEAARAEAPPTETTDTPPPEDVTDAEPPEPVVAQPEPTIDAPPEIIPEMAEIAEAAEVPPETVFAEQPDPLPIEVEQKPVETAEPAPPPAAVAEDRPEPALAEPDTTLPEAEPVDLQEAQEVEPALTAEQPLAIQAEAAVVPQPRPPARAKQPAQSRTERARRETTPVAPPAESAATPVDEGIDTQQPSLIAALTAGDAARVDQETSGSGPHGAAGEGADTGTEDAPSTGGDPGVRIDYMTQLAAVLSRHKRYPRRAQSRRQQGTGELQFVVDRSGTVVSFSLYRSSGYSLLDKEIMSILERVGNLPPIPDAMGVAQVEVIVPVSFSLR